MSSHGGRDKNVPGNSLVPLLKRYYILKTHDTLWNKRYIHAKQKQWGRGAKLSYSYIDQTVELQSPHCLVQQQAGFWNVLEATSNVFRLWVANEFQQTFICWIILMLFECQLVLALFFLDLQICSSLTVRRTISFWLSPGCCLHLHQ